MKLYIAEKPSLARAIADAFPKPQQKGDGFIRLKSGDCITWCIGHLLEQADPDAYDPSYKKWQLAQLPIIPQQWQLKPKVKTRKQLNVIKGLIKEADQIVHAGDPDREGQLLVDQVISYLGTSEGKKANTQRCLINDMNPAAVKRALSQLQSNKDFAPLSISALARSRADWLYGINMTRAYTLQGQKVGYDGVLSVGRVQTPILGLVVRRDRDISAFQTKPFYKVQAHLNKSPEQCFTALWQPSEACQPHMDEEGRVLSKKLAENVIARIHDKAAVVSKVDKKRRTQSPPLPYSLSALQIDANKRFGLSAQQVLDVCQDLYEKKKLITYPRSDSRYLPTEHLSHAPNVVRALQQTCPSLAKVSEQADMRLKSAAWNDKKVEAHHAIIPTEKKVDSASLSQQQQQVYELVARQYLCQFFSKHEYDDTRVEITIEGGVFLASSRQTRVLGWKSLFPTKKLSSADDEQTNLPDLKQGDALHCSHGQLLECETSPPKHFSDATLLAAMTGIARYVSRPEIRKVLKESDGLGTEATRAGIIELLFKRQYLRRVGKEIHATPAGQSLIKSLPPQATLPDMTAEWESLLNAISQKQRQYQHFMDPLIVSLHELIEQSKASLPTAFSGVKSQQNKRGQFSKKKRKTSTKTTKAKPSTKRP